MKLIESRFRILTPINRDGGVQCLRVIEQMGRVSHRSEDRQTGVSWEKFIDAVVLKHSDWSIVEHQSATVIFTVDRGVSHELVRHRLFSFTQESTRFVNYAKKGGDLEFIRPANLSDKCDWSFRHACRTAEIEYLDMLADGARPQEARAVLPNALACKIAMTGNLRSWRWFFLARTTKETHPDFLRVTLPLLEQFKSTIPLLYDDIEPLQKQSISMAKAH